MFFNHTKILHWNVILFIDTPYGLQLFNSIVDIQPCLDIVCIASRSGSAPPCLQSQLICSLSVWVQVNLNRFHDSDK